ncbi:hypothetical protein LTR66_000768 [Elasticomyces elasticus]|nr:hypothetical protein LTR66_000768 [Elasticomyces elasticus]
MATIKSTGHPYFRAALLFEACANLFGATIFTLAPRYTLSLLATSSVQITPLAVTLSQWLGGLTLALATPLVLAYPNTPEGIASRPTVYWTLGAGELCVVAIMGWQYMSNTSGMTARALAMSMGVLGGTLLGRLWVLIARPDLMGRVEGMKKAV